MKNLLIVGLCACFFVLFSCKDEEPEVSFVTPDCVETIIENMQENDVNPSCLASVTRYKFNGDDVFEVQEDACLDGPVVIIDMDCDTICSLVFDGFLANFMCWDSTDFYSDAELIEVLFEEEN
jgi:hypothetical protein